MDSVVMVDSETEEDSGSVVAVVEDLGSVVMVVEDSGSVVMVVEDSDFPKVPCPDSGFPGLAEVVAMAMAVAMAGDEEVVVRDWVVAGGVVRDSEEEVEVHCNYAYKLVHLPCRSNSRTFRLVFFLGILLRDTVNATMKV